MRVAVEALRAGGAVEVIVAVPTGHLDAVRRLSPLVETLCCANVRAGRSFAVADAYQPFFAPFPAFFAKALLSDVFVLFDSVQFSNGGTWLTRNRFKSDRGEFRVTIPAMHTGGPQRIDEVRICRGGNWARKRLASLRAAYGRAPFLEEHEPFLAGLFENAPDRLGGSVFLAQRAAEKFLGTATFAAAGLELRSFAYHSEIYSQLYGPFIRNLSAFDLLFTCGPKAAGILKSQLRPSAPAP